MGWKNYEYNAEDKKGAGGIWLKSYGDGTGTKYLTRGGQLWSNLNSRCSKAYQDKCPTYKGVVNLFEDFQSFMEWAHKQYGYLNKSGSRYWQLDKDLLGDGKVYSKDTCLFVPSEVNTLMHDTTENGLPKGVQVYQYDNSKFMAGCRVDTKKVWGGVFDTAEAAHEKWKELKRGNVSTLISKYHEHTKMIEVLTEYLETLK